MAVSGRELARRIGVAAVGIPAAVLFAYLGGYPLAALLAVLAALAAREFCTMHREQGLPASPAMAAILAATHVAMSVLLSGHAFVTWVVLTSLVVSAILALSLPPETRPGLAAVITVFGSAYTGLLLAFAVWLRALGGSGVGWGGAAVLFLPIAVTWLGDTAAYFAGSALGRHRLAPRTSPGKSWEGAAAGLLATAGGAVLYVAWTRGLVDWTLGAAETLGFGAAVAVAGQVGDLFESRLKRDCGVKDSSGLLPGHGGMLDRMDSLLFVFPVAYGILLLTGI